ncbi:MAG: hypothetical protein Q7U54_00555 [Bacteroidales bacterium]|nr:hypothetical protein [Bacteroidales bacterium]
MTKLLTFLLLVTLLHCNLAIAQSPSDYLPEKPGKWSYSNNITSTEAEYIAFSKVIASLAEWFHVNIPILKNPKGFDLASTTYGGWDKYYKMNDCNYGLRTELDFGFQLFFSAGGKRTIEPPHYSFGINNTEDGHGSNANYPYFDELKDDPGVEKAINEASIKMNGVFMVYPFVKALAPGVNLYDCENGGCGTVVVFNPERPDFWIPVTVGEMAEMHLQYYKLRNQIEMDRLLLEQLQKEISELPEEELKAPAFSGHDEHFVLKVNGKREGLQLMRFNPAYWNRGLPNTAIQFMTFYYPQMDEVALAESYKNNGHPFYSQLLVNEIDWVKLSEILQK